MNHKQRLLDVLVSLKQNGPKTNGAGICHVVYRSVFDEYAAIQSMVALLQEWPDGTGCSAYTVPLDGKIIDRNSLTPEELQQERDDAEVAYLFEHDNKWDKEDPYCQARYRLLDWMIQRLEEELK